MAFDFSNTLNGIVYLTPTQFTTLSNKNGTVSGATQLFSDKYVQKQGQCLQN